MTIEDPTPLSVLLSTYEGDSATELSAAIESVVDQTVAPSEIVLVEDGPLSDDLRACVDGWLDAHPELFVVHRLETNRGLGRALREGVRACSHDVIARMDSDDVCVDTRFETQLRYLDRHPDVDAVGGYMVEFDETPDADADEAAGRRVRTVPTDPAAVRRAAKFRSPINHPTVMYRKGAVLSAGNYRSLRSMQDYDLWVRMLVDGATITNLPEVLVRTRAGDDLYARRGGIEDARIDYRLCRDFLRIGFIGYPTFALNLTTRLLVRALPNRLRAAVYRRFLRD